MNEKNYKWVVGFIVLTILATIGVQVFWNFKEYQINKQHLISKVQRSLDNSVEAYFANLTRTGIIKYNVNLEERTDTIVVNSPSRNELRTKIDSTLKNISQLENEKPILIKDFRNSNYPFYTTDKTLPQNIDSLINKVFISISRDSMDLAKLDSHLSEELARHNLNINYGLKYDYRRRDAQDSLITESRSLNLENFPKEYLVATSKSTFLPRRGNLELLFTDEVAILLRKSLVSILLSFLLSAGIIASLVFLLKTIYKQKQLAEVKNDLINNITHEFKTPISTIGVALESIMNFNAIDDKEKTKTYLNISTDQLSKLNIMVEKLLETASLDSDNLNLNFDEINSTTLIQSIIAKHDFQLKNKTIDFKNNASNIIIKADEFHFENVINNIIDNAIKYGGDQIIVETKQVKNKFEISISDNGNSLTKANKDKIFEQFYRVPKGNTHDVKGFGIGLYYAKKIVEKHNGTIQVHLSNNLTTFKITIPNE
ncbi:HAMP domain-containing sensor histidine kinase [Aureibaculum sp. 2210JD6-5]|uniref:sensor histidine kinase n=1 Tax=Aureibaculum sp. 2210JD6-5 TaxID=3103957 RepID=UPI002AAD647A|nr:HAMP domain-containing sensor histidine kinase [Aureibaculum sp. 2210JD6-5]MDY7395822.1 HAMP domain-containing sensor histidine kinase [Aureibaculum sp. 2210JD6-5]